ncbi:MAG: hypothetical protein V1726_05050 [Methanobacteriota archaeon]
MNWIPFLLVFLILIATLIGLWKERYKSRKRVNSLLIILIIIAIITAGTQVWVEYDTQQKEKYTMNSGTISGETLDKNVTYPCLSLGGTNFIYEGPKGYSVLDILGINVTIWIENGKLKISTILRNENGEIVAELKANEWQVNPNLIFDRNFDDTAIEVINTKGDVVLQADLVERCVKFVGYFYREDGWQIAVGPSETGGGYIELRPPGEEIQMNFDKIFQYPSELHPGERV